MREIALDDDDVTMCAGVRVLTPEATALDLLRVRRRFGMRDAEALRGLVVAADLDPSSLGRCLAQAERAPMGRQAQRRFRDTGFDRTDRSPA
ncbi:hypothetical protein [Curtobacterium sp. MCPF17_052]|uniref:hypothetical protein n=1 Tax=Curtobacterium sp. MCPF17_052 TaxID=2175655 RepID=UPI0011B45BA4|nr:hypothetical protein [Curtobacterium sp. MCPF17_052]WIB12675.1 hypothetical protein DEJ36_00595 [Curtobacterium sp. MCPF17_052]